MALYDLVALVIWLVMLPGIKRLTTVQFDLRASDAVFVSLATLVVIELIWLRIGYPAP